MLKNFNIIIYKAEEGGYYSECPVLKGCYSQGETIEELKANMKEAIELYLENNPCLEQYIENQ